MEDNNPTPPNHRYELSLTWGCNSWSELLDRIDDWTLQQRVTYPDELESNHSGFGGGYSFAVSYDPGMNEERYRAELESWMQWRESLKAPSPGDGDQEGGR